MPKKEVMKLPVKDTQNHVETFIPVGVLEGVRSGPTLTVVGGVHASEYAAQDGVARFWESLDPQQISGRVFVVLAADVTALCAHHIYFNPVDEKNLNRIWPGKPDGTITEVIAHTLTQEIISKSDAIIDCHGGEFDETMAFYLITCKRGEPEIDDKTMALAKALGFPFIEVTDASGPWLGAGTLQGEAVRKGCPAMAIEAGERGIRDEKAISAVVTSLSNALKHLQMVPGDPVIWAGHPLVMKEGLIIKSKNCGLWEPAVEIGNWVEEGDLFGTIYDFDDTTLEEIRAAKSGTVLTVIIARAVSENGFVGKIGVL